MSRTTAQNFNREFAQPPIKLVIEMVLQFQALKLEKWLADNTGGAIEPEPVNRTAAAPKSGSPTPVERFKIMVRESELPWETLPDTAYRQPC